MASSTRGSLEGGVGLSYPARRHRRTKRAADEGQWEHAEITLEPLNEEFEPIVLTSRDEGDVRVVADLVQEVG